VRAAFRWAVDAVFGLPPGWDVKLDAGDDTRLEYREALADWDRRLAEVLRGRP
jgi:hypothetical protein